MPQINLLKQKTGTEALLERLPALAFNIVVIIVLVLFGFYVFLVLRLKSVNTQIASVQEQMDKEKAAAIHNTGRDELLTRQGQLAALTPLINKHLYWSQLFPELAKATLNGASYSDLKALSSGTIVLSTTVSSLQDLDKYLQVFDLADFNKNFSDVKIGTLHINEKGNGTAVKFDVQFKYNPDLIKYKNPA